MNLLVDSLWVFGDSFCTEGFPRWTHYLKSDIDKRYSGQLKDVRYYNYAAGSCDTRSILEFWLQMIPNMKENDAVVVCLSDTSRCRYPREVHNWDTMPFFEDSRHYPVTVFYDYAPKGIDYDVHIEKISNYDILWKHDKKVFEDFQDKYLLMSESISQKESLCKLTKVIHDLTPCKKKIIYNWVDWNSKTTDMSFVHEKQWLTDNVFHGYWETLNDEYKRYWGERGAKNDQHLSSNCEKLLYEHIKQTFLL